MHGTLYSLCAIHWVTQMGPGGTGFAHQRSLVFVAGACASEADDQSGRDMAGLISYAEDVIVYATHQIFTFLHLVLFGTLSF